MKRDLKADLELCNKATPGPWEICLGSGVSFCTAVMTADGRYMICYCLPDWFLDEGVAPENHVPNLQFIAEAREGWPHAIERARRAEAEVERLRGELEQLLEIAFAHIPDVMLEYGYYVNANPLGNKSNYGRFTWAIRTGFTLYHTRILGRASSHPREAKQSATRSQGGAGG